MRKPSLTFVTVITAATIVIGYLHLQLRAERDAAAQLREHVAQLEGAAQPAGSAALASRVAGQASAAGDPAVQEAPPIGPPLPGANPTPTPPRALFSPAIREELGLTEEEGEEFMRLLRAGGSQADFVALIGAARYEQYQQMQRAASREQRVNQLRTSLADTRHPLTAAQAAQLDGLLEAEQQRRAAYDRDRVRPTDPRALLEYEESAIKATQAATERMLADARGFMSVEQAAVLQGQLDSSASQQQDNLRTRRARLDAGGR
jgi:hypothetical protein